MRADAAILRRAYETLHPGLYRYNTRAQMERRVPRARSRVRPRPHLGRGLPRLFGFAAKVKCGHTYANFYNQRKAVQQQLFEAGRVPFLSAGWATG